MTDTLRRYQTWLQCGALTLLGLIAFAPSVNFDFVNWDDYAYLHENDLVKSWSLTNLKGVATEVVTRNYAPVTIFTFLIEHTFWGMNPAGYHATNIVLHLMNGLLVFFLLRQITGSAFVGWLTAAMFLLHPVQIESVVWISSRKGLLCSLFMLSALLVRMKPDAKPRDDAWYLLLLALALFSKAHAVVLPPIVLLYDLLIRQKTFATIMPRHVIPGLMSLLLLLMTMGAQNSVLGGVRQHMSLGLLQILAVDVTILWQYIGMLVSPANLCVMYDPPTSGIWKQVLAGSIGWTIVAILLFRMRRSQPLWILGAGSFLLLLFPMLNFFRITTLMNDRYLYLPCIVVFGMFAGTLQRILQVSPEIPEPLLAFISAGSKVGLSACVVVGCLTETSQHLQVWRNAESLWTHALSKYPDMPILRIQMALALHDSSQTEKALRVMTLALQECKPDDLDRERMGQFIADWRNELSSGSKVAERQLRIHAD